MNDTPVDRRLTDSQIEEIFREDLRPGLARHTSRDAPRLILLGGPQGSRKTSLRPLVAEQLGAPDIVFYDGDDHYTFHPHYDDLARAHGVLEAARLCGPDTNYLRAMILNEVVTRRLDIMLIGPYTNQDYTLARLSEFRAAGYSAELAYTALHPALSQVGVMDRHRKAVADGPGYSFLVSMELQQLVLDGVPAIMTVVEDRKLAAALHVVDAGGIAFTKRLNETGVWVPARPVRDVVEETRQQPWDVATRQGFVERRAAVAQPVGESPEQWGQRLARVDELAAPMLAAPTRLNTQAARSRSTTVSRPAKRSAAPPQSAGPASAPAPAPGRESSSGRYLR